MLLKTADRVLTKLPLPWDKLTNLILMVAYIERFNRIYRQEVLDMNLFQSIQQVQKKITGEWILEYNLQRPLESFPKIVPSGSRNFDLGR